MNKPLKFTESELDYIVEVMKKIFSNENVVETVTATMANTQRTYASDIKYRFLVDLHMCLCPARYPLSFLFNSPPAISNMEDYLKDSPSDIGTGGTTDSAGAGREGTLNTSYENDWKDNFENFITNSNNNIHENFDNGVNYNDFLGDTGDYSAQDTYGNAFKGEKYPNNNIDFNENYSNANAFQANANDLSSFGMNPTLSPSFDPHGFSNPGSLAPDPFLDDLDALGFPHNHEPVQYINPANTANLDELISPDTNDNFLTPQYFSPTNNQPSGFRLNLIAENAAQLAFSPHRQSISAGMASAPRPASAHLSPYLSPAENSLDTLRSPPFNGSFLQSPPTMRIPQSKSVPESQNNSYNSAMSPLLVQSGKQLTREEKLKRRREFHNAVERRRRDLIKERIKELGLLVPPSMLNPQLCAVQAFKGTSQLNTREINELLSTIKVKETKPNKSTILNKSVEYLLHLKYVLEEQEKARAKLEKQIQEALGSQPKEDTFNPDDFFLGVVDR